MDFSLVCRTCLGNQFLHPIFESTDTPELFSKAIFIGCGVQVKPNDNLPQHMCTTCMKQLNDALKFRNQSKKANIELLKIQSKLDSFKTNYTVTNEEFTEELTNRHELNTNISDVQNEKNNRIEFESTTNVKTESEKDRDIDDDKPLKLLIKNPMSSKNNYLKISSNEVLSDHEKQYQSLDTDTDYLYENESELKSEIISNEIDDITSTLNYFTPTKLKNNDTKQKLPKISDKIEFKNTVENYNEDLNTEYSKSMNEQNTEVPYNTVTESVKNKPMRVVCKLCQKDLSIRSMDGHMSRAHPDAYDRKVKCELCDMYVNKSRLVKHNMMLHDVECKCRYCETEFKSKDVLIEHVAACKSNKRKRKVNISGRELAECDICQQRMQKASLRMHKAVKHAGLRPVCEHCGKSFGNKFRLNEHYRAKHDYEKFQCTYCDFRSAGIMAMRNHERRHRGEKPFVCETCGAKFHAAYLLTQHRHSHRTEKLVKCDLCPASFKANNSLHMHKLTCHSKAVYRCLVCARSYKCRYYALKHMRLAHNHTGASTLLAKMTDLEMVG